MINIILEIMNIKQVQNKIFYFWNIKYTKVHKLNIQLMIFNLVIIIILEIKLFFMLIDLIRRILKI